jgi:hypothetical protein
VIIQKGLSNLLVLKWLKLVVQATLTVAAPELLMRIEITTFSPNKIIGLDVFEKLPDIGSVKQSTRSVLFS